MSISSFVRTPLRWIKRLVPQTLKQRYRNQRELMREKAELAAVARIECDVSRLGRLDPYRLVSFWNDSNSAGAWHEELPRVGELELPIMTGGVNPGDQRALYHLVLGLRPRHILEIGTHIGCSTLHIALALKRIIEGSAKDARSGAAGTTDQERIELVTADIRDVNDAVNRPWEAYQSKHSPRQMINRLGCADWVRFEIGDSLRFLGHGTDTFDLIFLDGRHDADRVYQEIPLALKRLRPGGFILLHDYFPAGKALWSNGSILHGPHLAVRRFHEENARFQVLPFAPCPGRRSLDRTSPVLH